MAVTAETYRLLRKIRIFLDENVDVVTSDLVLAWSRAWDTLVIEWEAAVAELQDLRDDGEWPTRAQIRRAERTTKALFMTRQALDDLMNFTGVTVLQAVPDAVALAEDYLKVIASQYPPEAGGIANLTASLSRVDRRQIDAIVHRTTGSIVSLLRPLTMEAYGALYSGLVRGVTLGQSPRTVAARLLRRLEGAFNGGLTRAMVIARTELLDAHRVAAAATQKANASVLAEWQWIATLDKRTCPSCWSQHGSTHPLNEPGPLDHQQGRCARLPITKSWADLGFEGIEEPASLVPNAQDVFAGLTRAEQLQVMGAPRLALLDAGDINWSDLSALRTTTGWRNSYGVAPLSALV